MDFEWDFSAPGEKSEYLFTGITHTYLLCSIVFQQKKSGLAITQAEINKNSLRSKDSTGT